MASNKQNLDKDALVYLIEQIINGDEAVEAQIETVAGEVSSIVGRTNITDTAFEILDKMGNVIATYGAETQIRSGESTIRISADGIEIGNEHPLVIKQDGLYLPNASNIKIADGKGVDRDIGNIAIYTMSSITTDANNNVIGKETASILADGTLEIYGTHKDDWSEATNTAFGTNTGLYYFDVTTLLSAIGSMKRKGFDDYDEIASSGDIFIEVSTNGNSGSGYITPWRTIFTHGGTGNTPRLSTRMVSTSRNSAGILSYSYHVRIGYNRNR